MRPKHILKVIGAGLMTGAAVLLAEIIRAAHRSDLPSLDNQDPSGVFGSPDLPSLRIAALGDSSVTAPGVDPIDAAWVRRIAIWLSNRYQVTLESFAVGGAKTRDVITTQLPAAIAFRPDLALLSVGANDALRATPPARFRREYREIVANLHDHANAVGCGGVGDLGSIPRLGPLLRVLSSKRARQIDAIIAEVVAEFPRAAKADSWSEHFSGFYNDRDWFAPDLFHASGKGHAAFAASAYPVIEELLPHL